MAPWHNRYGNSTGAVSPSCDGACTVPGRYCPAGSSDASGAPCPAGSFSTTGAGACTPCPAGQYGSTTALSTAACSGQCSAGYACPAGSLTPAPLGSACQLGKYSLSGAAVCTNCSIGLYGSSTGLTTASCSGPCAAGTYGATTGLTSSGCTGPCSPGKDCARVLDVRRQSGAWGLGVSVLHHCSCCLLTHPVVGHRLFLSRWVEKPHNGPLPAGNIQHPGVRGLLQLQRRPVRGLDRPHHCPLLWGLPRRQLLPGGIPSVGTLRHALWMPIVLVGFA
jgi:hypothetical protein